MSKNAPDSIGPPAGQLNPFYTVMIAGTHSSVGKTTWSLALMSYFRKKGWEVQPFKVGPDYIDPGFHNQICGPRQSRNLDHFFLSEDYLRDSFKRHSAGARIAIVEGVMGLFDGRAPLSEEGSTAQMAKLLGLPVFLVIDAAGLARSAAALVKGFQSFNPDLKLKGVFLNRVGGEGHLQWLRDPVEKETGVPVLGWLPSEAAISIPERHLGLRTVLEEEGIEAKLNRLGELLKGRFEEEKFLISSLRVPISAPPAKLGRSNLIPRLANSSPVLSQEGLQKTLSFPRKRESLRMRRGSSRSSRIVLAHRPPVDSPVKPGNDKPGRNLGDSVLRTQIALPAEQAARAPRHDCLCRIGIAYDRAFSFYYADNFDLLREAGAELVFFSPLNDGTLPPNLGALYFGGGFPEIFAERLSRNESLRESIRKFHEEGRFIYAECGGLMYLAESFAGSRGETFPLVGLLPGEIRMSGRLQHFGYHEAECQIPTFLFPAGRKIRSHEFHYSIWQEGEGKFQRPYRIEDRTGGRAARLEARSEGFYDGRLLASYQHLHFGQDPELARNFVAAAGKRERYLVPSNEHV